MPQSSPPPLLELSSKGAAASNNKLVELPHIQKPISQTDVLQSKILKKIMYRRLTIIANIFCNHSVFKRKGRMNKRMEKYVLWKQKWREIDDEGKGRETREGK